MLFPLRQRTDYLQSAPTLNNSFSFGITREFFLSTLYVVIPFTVAGTITSAITWNTMGLAELVKNVKLNIADGSSNRDVVNCSGGALIRYAARIVSGLDAVANIQGTLSSLGLSLNQQEGNSAGSSAGNYELTIPIFFRHPQLSDPIGSATMLPLPRYNTNPVLTITLGAVSDAILTNHGATITPGVPYMVRKMRQVDNILFPTLDTEFKEISAPQAATGTSLKQTLDVPGSYTNIDIYTQNSTGAGANISGGLWLLQFLSQQLRQFNLSDIKRDEQYTMGNDCYIVTNGFYRDFFPGFYHLDFLHDEFGMEVGELGSLLNVNVLAGSGALLEVIMNLASTGTVNFAYQRIFGDLSPYTIQFNTAAG